MPYARRSKYSRPSRRRSTRYSRRTGYRKSYKTVKAKSYSILPSPSKSIVANRFHTKLTYCTPFDLSGVTTTPTYYKFRLNSIHDPDLTGIGHQPRGHDELELLYEKYVVHGCKIIIDGFIYSPDPANATAMAVIGIGGTTDVTTPAQLEDLREDKEFTTIVTNNRRSFHMSKYFDVAKTAGIRKSKVQNESTYAAFFGANPTNTQYIHVGMVPQNALTSTSVQFSARLIYYVTVFDPKRLSQS